MSKIFEALNRGKNDLAESIRSLTSVPEQPQSDPPRRGRSRGVLLRRLGADQNSALVAAPAGAVPTEEAAPAVKEPIEVEARRLPLRIPAPSALFPFDSDCWEASEQYRILRAKLGQHPKQPRVIVVSSPGPLDGKTVSAVNVAGALSLKDQSKVLLLEADMRRPTLDARLGIPKTPGLADVLMGACTLKDALVQAEELPNLYIITAGATPPNAAELLETAHWHTLCERMRAMFRYTIMDSPPMAAVADFDLIQAACDGVILVVRPDRTNRALCKKSLEMVAKNKFLGVLLNWVPEWHFGGKSSYYDPYYRSAQ